MTALLARGTILGGSVLFVWGALSWMVLPWRHGTLLAFSNEDAITQAVLANAPRSGVYLLPNTPQGAQGMTPEQAKAAQQAEQEKMMKGPMVFASVRLGPMGSMAGFMITGLLIQMLGALLATALLLHARPMSFRGRVLFVLAIALTVGVVAHLSDWNWWGFSTSYTVLEFADLIVGWSLAGLVIAAIAKQKVTKELPA